MPPAPASKHRHWSKVEAAQEFTLVLKYDENLYRPATVTVRLRRHATTGLTQSAEPIWEWAVKTLHGESKLKACAVAGCACKRTTPKGKGRAPPGV